MLKELMTVSGVLLLSACATKASMPEIEGYQMLTMPSNNYEVGDLIAVYTDPPKEDVIFSTEVDASAIRRSAGPDLGSISNFSASGELEGRLEKSLEASVGGSAVRIRDVVFENTEVRTAEVSGLSQTIIDQVSADPGKRDDILYRTQSVCSFFGMFCRPRTRLDVMTETLSADVTYSLESSTSADAEAAAQRLAASVEGEVEVESSLQRTVTAKGLVIGYRADPIGAERVISVLRQQADD